LADLDSTGAGGFWMSEAAMSDVPRLLECGIVTVGIGNRSWLFASSHQAPRLAQADDELWKAVIEGIETSAGNRI
jgi:hypothetical protein